MAGRHTAGAVAKAGRTAAKAAPLPVKAGAKGATMVAKAAGRHRASGQVDMRGKAPAATGQHRAPEESAYDRRKRSAPASSGESPNPLNRVRKSQGTEKTQYVGKKALYNPRSSRTHYIRYIGNQEASSVNKLIGEWFLGVVLICIAVPTQSANNGYAKTITAIMYRLTALTAVFFVLALMANTKGSKTAVYAGALIDLGIAFNAMQSGTLRGAANMITGKPILDNAHSAPAADVAQPAAHPIQGGLFDQSQLDAASGGSTGGARPA